MRVNLSLYSWGQKDLSILTFGSTEKQVQSCQLVKVSLETKTEESLEVRLLSVPHVCEPLSSSAVDLEKYFAFENSELADELEYTGLKEPQILIGSDQYWKLLTGETVRSENGPVAVHTRLGWVISGPVDIRAKEPNTASLVTHILKVDSELEKRRLEKQLGKFWELESLGINDTEESVHDQFRDIVAFKKGRYEVSLPWKDPSIVLPDN